MAPNDDLTRPTGGFPPPGPPGSNFPPEAAPSSFPPPNPGGFQPPASSPFEQPAPGGYQPFPQAGPPYQQPAPYQPQAYPPFQQPYGGAYITRAPSHPSATTAMVVGIVALAGTFFCGFPILASPFAWYMGAKAVKEIDLSNGAYSGREQARAGQIMGIIGTVLMALVVAFFVFLIAVAATTSA